MTFEIKKKESVRKAVKRLARRRLEKARGELRRSDRLEAVHGVRKEIKALRAMLRLVRPAMTPSDYRKYSDALREAASQLSAARDAHVKVNALAELADHFKRELAERPFRTISRILAEDCREQRAGLGQDRKVGRSLKKLAREFASVNLKESGWAAIAPGLKRSYRDGRRGYKSALESGTPACFHEWRKRVKDLYYQIKLLCPIWPEQMMAAEAELKHLGECLGDDHDLFLLTEPSALSRFKPEAEDEAAALKPLVNQRQKELRAQSLALGARFYAEKPSVLCKRVGQYWQRWRREPGRIRKSGILQNQ